MSNDISINTTLVWNGDASIQELTEARFKGLTESAILVQDAAKTDAPVLTGTLRADINRDVDADEATVGNSLLYPLYVEKGTRRQRAQPYLFPALMLNIKKIEKIFARAYKGSSYID